MGDREEDRVPERERDLRRPARLPAGEGMTKKCVKKAKERSIKGRKEFVRKILKAETCSPKDVERKSEILPGAGLGEIARTRVSSRLVASLSSSSRIGRTWQYLRQFDRPGESPHLSTWKNTARKRILVRISISVMKTVRMSVTQYINVNYLVHNFSLC